MKSMRLHGMARAFKTSLERDAMEQPKITADEFVCQLVECEWDERYNRKLDRSLKNARFRYKAEIEQIDFVSQRNLDKNQLIRLADCRFVEKMENVIITGSTGIGKSYVASALGHQACSLGYKVMYEYTSRLFSRLKMCKADGSYLKELSKIEKQDLLILDDFGIQPLDHHARSMLLEIMEDRHGKKSTMITAQVPVGKWFDVIGEQTIADALLDRLIHDSHRIEMKGDSLRKRKNTNFDTELND